MADSGSDASLPPPAASAELPRGLLRFDERLAGELFAFQREAFPTRRPDWVEPRWRWMFLESAARLGVQPYVWLFRSKRGIVAHQGAIAVRLHTRAGEVTTGWFVETMVLEEVRGKAVGPMLVTKAVQDLPFNLSLGQTELMRELQYKLGWRRVAPLETLVFVLRGAPVVRGKFPAPIAAAAGLALNLSQRLRHWRGRGRRQPFSVRTLPRFDRTHDDLWAEVRNDYPVAVVRDASYLNWKYVDQPGQAFDRLEVSSGGRIIGIAVVSFSDADDAYRYRRAWLTELVVSPRDDGAVWGTLEAVRRHASGHHADLISFDLISEPLVERALAFGFVRRPSTRELLISPGPEPDAIAQLALDGRHWLITRGDSDIDRPW